MKVTGAGMLLVGLLAVACRGDVEPDGCLAGGLVDLADARWVEPRLSGIDGWAECARRAVPDDAVPVSECASPHFLPPPVSPSLQGCDAQTRTHVEAVRTLILEPQRTAAAVAELEGLLSRRADAGVASDLSAGYLLRAQREDRPSDLLAAGAAARRAVSLAPRSAAARFNLALSLEALRQPWLAMDAWSEAASLDLGSRWSDEAGRRRQRLLERRMAAAATRWPLNRERVAAAVRASDREAVAALVAPFPAAARRWLEEEVLPAWAEGWLAGLPDEAGRLPTALAVAEALAESTRDRYSLAGVVPIVRATEGATRGGRASRLAQGHHSLGRALAEERQHRWSEAAKHHHRAVDLLRPTGSPFAQRALIGVAIARSFDAPDSGVDPLTDAQALLDPIEEEARRRGFHYLIGRVLWLRAFFDSLQGKPLRALDRYNSALAAFGAIDDGESVANVRARKVGILRDLGQSDQAWREAWSALAQLPRVVEVQAQHHLLGEAAAAALAMGEGGAALVFQDRAVELIRDELSRLPDGDDRLLGQLRNNLAIAMRARAEIHLQLGRPRQAESDLAESDRLHRQNADEGTRRALHARIREVDGRLLLGSRPDVAAAAFTEALRSSTAEEYSTQRVRLLLLRALAHRRSGRTAAAERDLKAGLEELRQEEERLLASRRPGQHEAVWGTYFERFQDAYRLLIELLVEADRAAEAFTYAEKSRAGEPLDLVLRLPGTPASFRRRLANGEPLGLGEIQGSLPAGTLLVEFSVHDERSLVWAVSREGAEFLSLPVGRSRIEDWAEELHRSAELRDEERFRGALGDPYRALFAPVLAKLAHRQIDRLVVVPDGAVHGLPVAALSDGRGSHLVERFPIAVAPSATLYVHSLLRDRRFEGGRTGVLLVGEPAFEPGSDFTRGLGPLPGAAREVDRLAVIYGDEAVVLRGEEAVPEAFLAAARKSAVVHFAGHAVANREVPSRSLLVLAPSTGRRGELFAEELLRELPPTRTRLFVLSACSSSGGHAIGPQGLAALVRPFIAAGATGVLGTLWNIGDQTSDELLVEFHRRYHAGIDAAAALRQAQLHLLRAAQPGISSPLAWAPFHIVGYASSPWPPLGNQTRRTSP